MNIKIICIKIEIDEIIIPAIAKPLLFSALLSPIIDKINPGILNAIKLKGTKKGVKNPTKDKIKPSVA